MKQDENEDGPPPIARDIAVSTISGVLGAGITAAFGALFGLWDDILYGWGWSYLLLVGMYIGGIVYLAQLFLRRNRLRGLTPRQWQLLGYFTFGYGFIVLMVFVIRPV